MIGPALFAYLTNVSTATFAIVGSRIYPVTLPQEPVLPCISYQLIAEPRQHTLDGRAAPSPYIQIDCWGLSYSSAGGLADAVSTDLDCFRGTFGTLFVSACIQRARRELFEQETKEYRVSVDFSITHN